MKRIITFIVVIALLSCVSTAVAAGAGSASDPLVSKHYASDIFDPVMRRNSINAVEKAVTSTKNAAEGKLQKLYNEYMMRLEENSDYALSDGVELLRLRGGGGKIVGKMGTSFAIASGSAILAITEGEVLDLTTGKKIDSGTALSVGKRYFCTENTIASVKAEENTYCLVDGYYIADLLGFKDVKTTDWFYDAVAYVCFNQLFAGMSKTEFAPSLPMTRGMIVTVLYSLDGKADVSGIENSFRDVKDGDWYMDAVKWANANGIVAGYGNGKFGPNDVVTRQQIAVILYRYAEYKGYDTSVSADITGYKDYNQIASWAREAMSWARGMGLISGMSASELSPLTPALRAQVAVILQNFCETTAKTSLPKKFVNEQENTTIENEKILEKYETNDTVETSSDATENKEISDAAEDGGYTALESPEDEAA